MLRKSLFLGLLFFAFCGYVFADESLVITTYYPSPFGNYNELRAKKVAVGSTYVDGTQYGWSGVSAFAIDSEVDLAVQRSVSIGTVGRNVVSNGAKLNVDGDIRTNNGWITSYDAGITAERGSLRANNGNIASVRNDQAALLILKGRDVGNYDGFAGIHFKSSDDKQWAIGHKGNNAFGIYYCSAACDTNPGNWYRRMEIDSAGPITIENNLTVNGSFASSTCLSACAAVGHTHPSDIRLKKNVKTLESALERMLKLRGVEFEWTKAEYAKEYPGTQVGMIAQEVEKVFPQWVQIGEDGYKTLSFRGIEGLTVEALRELKTENEGLKAKNTELEERIKAIEAKLNIN